MSNIETFDYSVDLLKALIWQYDSAPAIQSLLKQKSDWYTENQTTFWTNWYNNVFNLQTANTFGLAVWAVILNIPLFIPIDPEPTNAPIFGFNGGTFGAYENSYKNFNAFGGLIGANFSNRGSAIYLSIEEQRVILKLRYFQLTTRGDITDINAFLSKAFTGLNRVTAFDGFDMTMRYVFAKPPSLALLLVLKELDLLPRPAGVGVTYVITQYKTFGFGRFNQNFENGNFLSPFI